MSKELDKHEDKYIHINRVYLKRLFYSILSTIVMGFMFASIIVIKVGSVPTWAMWGHILTGVAVFIGWFFLLIYIFSDRGG